MKNDMKGLADVYAQAAVTPVAEKLRKLEEMDRQKELARYDSKPVADYYLGKKKSQLLHEQSNMSGLKEALKELYDLSYEIFEIGSRIKYKEVRPEDAEYLHSASRKIEKFCNDNS